MPQYENDAIVEHLVKILLDVITRRTSEAYAIVVLNNVLNNLEEKHSFLNYIKLKKTQELEVADIIEINSDINIVEINLLANAISDLVETLTKMMGKEAGFFFIREVSEDISIKYVNVIKELGVDFNAMQFKFLTEKKIQLHTQIENSAVLKYILTILFDILERDISRNFAVSTMTELIERFSIQYNVLKHVTINDIRFIQGVDPFIVAPDVNVIDKRELGGVIQKIIQEVNNTLEEKGGKSFISKIKDNISTDYTFKLEEMGVNLNVILLQQGLVVKHVIKALIEILSEASSSSYAVMAIDNVIKKTHEKHDYLKYIRIDSSRYSDGIDAVDIPKDIDKVRTSELGRGIQKIIESVAKALGEQAGEDFVERFRLRIGKTYILRLEEMGINLHVLEMRQNLFF